MGAGGGGRWGGGDEEEHEQQSAGSLRGSRERLSLHMATKKKGGRARRNDTFIQASNPLPLRSGMLVSVPLPDKDLVSRNSKYGRQSPKSQSSKPPLPLTVLGG